MIKAIVTGHSRGLGAATASILLERGIAVLGLARASNVGLADRHPGRLEEVGLDLAGTAALQRDGALARANDCARGIVDCLLADSFGGLPVADLRELKEGR